MNVIRWQCYPLVATPPSARMWLEMQANFSRAPNTIAAYGAAPQDYLAFSARHGVVPITAPRAHIAAFVRDLTTRPNRRTAALGLANATLHQRLTVVRLFYDYLVEEGLREAFLGPAERRASCRYTAQSNAYFSAMAAYSARLTSSRCRATASSPRRYNSRRLDKLTILNTYSSMMSVSQSVGTSASQCSIESNSTFRSSFRACRTCHAFTSYAIPCAASARLSRGNSDSEHARSMSLTFIIWCRV